MAAIVSSSLLVPQVVRDTTIRRIIPADLRELLAVINSTGSQDAMTENLRNWQQRFLTAFQKYSDSAFVIKVFIGLLQEILLDPISHTPLDENAVLGSDGITYGSYSLALYIQSAPKELKHRSPLSPTNPASFFTIPHPVVPAFIKWLKKNNALQEPVELKQRYRMLATQHPPEETVASSAGRVPTTTCDKRIRHIQEIQARRNEGKQRRVIDNDTPASHPQQEETVIPSAAATLPTAQSERIRRIRERQQQRNQEKDAQEKAFVQELQQLQQESAREVKQAFASVHQQVADTALEHMQRLDNLEAKDQADFDELLDAARQIEKEITQLENDTAELNKKIHSVKESISETERENACLQIAVNELRQAIKEQEKGWLGAVFGSLAAVGVCAFATWAVQGGMTAAGSSGQATVTPIDKGAMLNLKFLF